METIEKLFTEEDFNGTRKGSQWTKKMNDLVEDITKRTLRRTKQGYPWNDQPGDKGDQIMRSLFVKKSEKESKKTDAEIYGESQYCRFMKYFFEVSKREVKYGLYIERSTDESEREEWNTFEKKFQEIFDLTKKISGMEMIYNTNTGEQGNISSLDEAKICFERWGGITDVWVNLYISKKISKDRAISMSRKDWINEINETFKDTKPIYMIVKNKTQK